MLISQNSTNIILQQDNHWCAVHSEAVSLCHSTGLFHQTASLASRLSPLFESVVLANCALTFFKCLYSQWFNKWGSVDKAEREQRKIVRPSC